MRKVLIIDDSMTTRSILKRMLKELGFETHEADNGASAIEKLKELDQCQLALVDWNMPIMNGLDFIKTIRKDNAYENMKLIMVTTETEMSRVVDAITAGANEYVMKPFTKDIISEKIKMTGLTTE